MNDRDPALIVNVLQREFPDVAALILLKIDARLPRTTLSDPTHIDQIVKVFKREKGVTEFAWTKGSKLFTIVHTRQQLVAVTLLFYHPEKLMDLTTLNTKHGIIKRVAGLIGTSKEVLSMDVPNVIVAFKAYEEFRQEVYRLYELIRIENKFFE